MMGERSAGTRLAYTLHKRASVASICLALSGFIRLFVGSLVPSVQAKHLVSTEDAGWTATARFQWNGNRFLRAGLDRKPFKCSNVSKFLVSHRKKKCVQERSHFAILS